MDERPATDREACRSDSCREGQFAACSSAGRAPRLGRGGRRIMTCHPDQRPLSLNGRTLRSERRYGGSIPPRGATSVQWRNGNAAVCKSVMSRLDTGLHLQALVARMDRPPPSKHARGFESRRERGRKVRWIERPNPGRDRIRIAISNYGELAERQGIAMLTRRDLRVGQVRLLHSPLRACSWSFAIGAWPSRRPPTRRSFTEAPALGRPARVRTRARAAGWSSL
jgi:hypothetical protein